MLAVPHQRRILPPAGCSQAPVQTIGSSRAQLRFRRGRFHGAKMIGVSRETRSRIDWLVGETRVAHSKVFPDGDEVAHRPLSSLTLTPAQYPDQHVDMPSGEPPGCRPAIGYYTCRLRPPTSPQKRSESPPPEHAVALSHQPPASYQSRGRISVPGLSSACARRSPSAPNQQHHARIKISAFAERVPFTPVQVA